MDLLKHGDFTFKNILSGGYNITEDEPDIISEVTMVDGTIKRNYGRMPKTSIKVKFGQLNKDTYQEYMSHFSKMKMYILIFHHENSKCSQKNSL